MAYLLDTNVLSELRRGDKGHPGVRKWMRRTLAESPPFRRASGLTPRHQDGGAPATILVPLISQLPRIHSPTAPRRWKASALSAPSAVRFRLSHSLATPTQAGGAGDRGSSLIDAYHGHRLPVSLNGPRIRPASMSVQMVFRGLNTRAPEGQQVNPGAIRCKAQG